ncbi:hypothetical protein CKO41_03660 [Thiococcus pfennigii]|nr:hypothetical protein [Thiococcus pfennigii]
MAQEAGALAAKAAAEPGRHDRILVNLSEPQPRDQAVEVARCPIEAGTLRPRRWASPRSTTIRPRAIRYTDQEPSRPAASRARTLE